MNNTQVLNNLHDNVCNGTSGVFFVIANPEFQRQIADKYVSKNIAIYDYAEAKKNEFDLEEMSRFFEETRGSEPIFFLNFQIPFLDKEVSEQQDAYARLNECSANLLKNQNYRPIFFFMTPEIEENIYFMAADFSIPLDWQIIFLDGEPIIDIPLPEFEEGADEYEDEDEDEDEDDDEEFYAEQRLFLEAYESKCDDGLHINIGDFDLTVEKDKRKLLLVARDLDYASTLHKSIKEFEKAELLALKALEICKSVFGEDHKKTIEIYLHLAHIYRDMQNAEKALDLYKKVLEFHEKQPNYDPFDSMLLHCAMGRIYSQQNESRLALDCFVKGVAISETASGIINPYTAVICDNIALLYEKEGDYENALIYCDKSYSCKSPLLSQRREIKRLEFYLRIANAYTEDGNFQKAFNIFVKSLKIIEQISGKNSHEWAQLYCNIGYLYRVQEDYQTALEYYQTALDVVLKISGENHEQTAGIYFRMATIYREQGNTQKALKYFQKALKISIKTLGDHMDTAHAYNRVALILGNQGDSEKALALHQKSLKIIEQISGVEHPETAVTYSNIADVYFTMKNYEKTVEFSIKALKISEKIFGTEHQKVAKSCRDLAYYYEEMGEYKKAFTFSQKSLKILEKVGTEDPEEVKELQDQCIRLLSLMR